MLTDMSIQLSIVASAGAIIISTAARLFWHTTHDLWPRRRGRQDQPS